MFITQEMIDAGGFTLEAGHFEVDPDNTSPSAPMIPVVDDYKFYDFQKGKWLGPATIDSVSLERLTPPAKINSVSLERVQIKKATIDSVLLERISAPPPPPERKATLSGKVVSIIGPVGGAEVSLDEQFKTTTAADGTFTIRDIPYGTYTLRVAPKSIIHKLLLKGVERQENIYMSRSIVVTLPVNYLNLGLLSGVTIGATVAVYEATKPKYPAYY